MLFDTQLTRYDLTIIYVSRGGYGERAYFCDIVADSSNRAKLLGVREFAKIVRRNLVHDVWVKKVTVRDAHNFVDPNTEVFDEEIKISL